MPTVFYVHWNEEELTGRVRALEAAGYRVLSHSSTSQHARLAEPYPDAVVISLDRLPSHGRAIAEWFWEAKKRQAIPIVFEGGAQEKVAATRARFPKARFCKTGGVVPLPERLGIEP
jgi:hypothetical protein